MSGVANDPVRSVCEQALFFDRVAKTQQARIGANRFWTVGYEEYCRRPRDLVERIAADVLGNAQAVHGRVPRSFTASSANKVEDAVAARIDQQLDELKCAASRAVSAPASKSPGA
jgi:hypothetical protein